MKTGNPYIRSSIYVLCAGLLFSRCTAPGSAAASESATAQLLFVAYEAKKDTASGSIAVAEIFQMQQPGNVTETEPVTAPEANDWIISFLDDKDRMVLQRVVKDPFRRKLEGVTEGGGLQQQEVKVERAEVTLRVNRLARMKKIRIETTANKGRKKIFEHRINNP